MASRPRNWEGLTTAYRRRLEGAGITQASYEAGANLNAARGHRLPSGAPNKALRAAAATGQFEAGQRAELQNWRRTRAPKWLGDSADVGNETAALVATLPNPKRWHSVEFVELSSSGKVEMFVVLKDASGGPGERVMVVLPDNQAAKQIGDRLRLSKFKGLDVDFRLIETNPKMNNDRNQEPTPPPTTEPVAAAPVKKATKKKATAKKKPAKKSTKKKATAKKKPAKRVAKQTAPPLAEGVAELVQAATDLGIDVETLLRQALDGLTGL